MLEKSAYASLFIQFITGVIDIYGLTIKVPEDKMIFRELLQVELGVQTVEFVYYTWMVNNIKNFDNITPTRYFDWFITTPTMLVTLMAYLDNSNPGNLHNFINNNQELVLEILVLNWFMLIFGLTGEFKQIQTQLSVILGFVPFAYYYKMIYDKFINKNSRNDQIFLYWFYLITWSLYGFAALLSYDNKNTMYNILDLFAKNFLGIFLVYVLYTNRIK